MSTKRCTGHGQQTENRPRPLSRGCAVCLTQGYRNHSQSIPLCPGPQLTSAGPGTHVRAGALDSPGQLPWELASLCMSWLTCNTCRHWSIRQRSISDWRWAKVGWLSSGLQHVESGDRRIQDIYLGAARTSRVRADGCGKNGPCIAISSASICSRPYTSKVIIKKLEHGPVFDVGDMKSSPLPTKVVSLGVSRHKRCGWL